MESGEAGDGCDGAGWRSALTWREAHPAIKTTRRKQTTVGGKGKRRSGLLGRRVARV
jgi:hypothetical protein